MPALAARILAAALLEGDDLLAAGLRHHGPGHRDPGHDRGADLDAIVVREHQHLVERDGFARLACELGDRDGVLGGDAILLAAGLDHCEHRLSSCSNPALCGRPARPASWQFRLRRTAARPGPPQMESAGLFGARAKAVRLRRTRRIVNRIPADRQDPGGSTGSCARLALVEPKTA
jgi:hypothetical protein